MSRKPQTCGDCARRKIKCDKVIPCSNCVKRGASHLCRRAEVAHSVERHSSRPSPSLSLGASFSASPRRSDVDGPINERILNLVTTLSDRVKHLEAKLDGSPEPRKRHVGEKPSDSQAVFQSSPPHRAFKQAKLTPADIPESGPCLEIDESLCTENESSSVQNSSDAAAEDAATVLEFLSWGRLKDSILTTGARDHELAAYPDKGDVLQTAQAWGNTPTTMSSGPQSMEILQMTQIQEMIPRKEQVSLLFEYHANWILFLHSSFHVQTCRQELEQFYEIDIGTINMTSFGLQWTSLLFAILCGSMACARPPTVVEWGFHQDDQGMLAKQWYQASVECLNIARYQQNHKIYSVQAITTLTISAHSLGFSNSQSVLLASAVRIAHSLGIHRLPRSKTGSSEVETEGFNEALQKEMGRRLWQQLSLQDWFSVPFSETYCVNPLHFTTKPPLHCDEETLEPLSPSKPSITSFGSFLYRIAALMPVLQDRVSQAPTLNAKYEQVLHFDKLMRDLVLSQLPSCLNSQADIDPSWPCWVSLSRKCLNITSAHKIIMIHRKFLGMSFHNKQFAFTRRTCLAAAKTIIHELKEEVSKETPLLWSFHAFSTAAAIILALDNFNRHQSAREYAEHHQLVSETIEILSASVAVSSIAARGTRLLSELLAEEQKLNSQTADSTHSSHNGKQRAEDSNAVPKNGEKSLNVAEFVKKFCESDLPPSSNSPSATKNVPLWLQDSSSSMPHSGHQGMAQGQYAVAQMSGLYSGYHANAPQQEYETMDAGYQMASTSRRQYDSFSNACGQNFGESFDIRSVTWFDDLLGLAPSHSI